MQQWKRWAQTLKRETYALYLAYKDPRVPWTGRVFAALVVAYAFSPIDLIPDPIPVLGYLDDLLLVPLGIWLALRFIPDEVMAEARAEAAAAIKQGKPVNWVAAIVVVALWLVMAALLLLFLLQRSGV